MMLKLSWALGFKVFTLLYLVGMVGAMLRPSSVQPSSGIEHPGPDQKSQGASPNPPTKPESTGPLTRAMFDQIYFDVVRASGQGEELQIELRALNTGSDRNIVPGRAKGMLEPLLFATVFDEQGEKRYADQVRIANLISTSGYLPQMKLIVGVPTAIVCTFHRMPTVAGMMRMRTIPRLEVPVVVGGDQESFASQEQGQVTVLVFADIPVQVH